MAQTETLRSYRVDEPIDAYGFTSEDIVLHVSSPMLDYPIVRCGDSKVVLAVDREELAGEALRIAGDGNERMVMCVLDAILAKLDLREVEDMGRIHDNGVGDPAHYFYSGSVTDGNYRTVDAYDIGDVALLKPSPTSKEGE